MYVRIHVFQKNKPWMDHTCHSLNIAGKGRSKVTNGAGEAPGSPATSPKIPGALRCSSDSSRCPAGHGGACLRFALLLTRATPSERRVVSPCCGGAGASCFPAAAACVYMLCVSFSCYCSSKKERNFPRVLNLFFLPDFSSPRIPFRCPRFFPSLLVSIANR